MALLILFFWVIGLVWNEKCSWLDQEEKKKIFFVIERVDKINLPLHRKQKKNNEKVDNWEVNTRIFFMLRSDARPT